MQTWSLKPGRPQPQARNNGDVFKALSIFVHRFNLLFLFWFINCCIRCAWRLCYCCCPLAVCLDQLWLILPGVDWTLQMSAYNLLIPFISGCCCWCTRVGVYACARVCMRACLSKTDGGGWLCLCVGNESISFTLVSSPDRGGRAPLCFLPLYFYPCFLTYARSILSLSFSVSFVSYSS